MKRAASAAIVYVLPVPALASSTVTPLGSAPVRSNGCARVVGPLISSSTTSRASSGSHSAVRELAEPLDGRQLPAEHEPVLGLGLLALDRRRCPARSPALHRRGHRSSPPLQRASA